MGDNDKDMASKQNRRRTDNDGNSLEQRVSDIEKESAVSSALLGKNIALQEKLQSTLSELSNVITDVRIAINSMQAEIKNHSVIIEKTGKSIEDIRLDATQISNLQTKLTSIERETGASVKRLDGRIDEVNVKTETNSKNIDEIKKEIDIVDDKSKIDIVDAAKKGILWLLAGGGIIYIIELGIKLFQVFMQNKP